jgi:PAS domain S-box-containing protein
MAAAETEHPSRIIDAFEDAVFVIDLTDDGRIVDVNDAAVAWLGVGRSAVVGDPISRYLTRRAGGADDLRIDERLDGRTIELSLRGPERARPVEVRFRRMRAPDHGRLVAIAWDVRERLDVAARLVRLAEAEHDRAAELNAVIRAMGEGVVVCAADGRILLSNPAGQDLFPDVVERSYAEILAELADPERVAPRLGTSGGPIALEARREPGRWIEITTYPVDGRGRARPPDAIETIVVLRDVTAARQRETVRETFIGVLSHELRTPITTIYGGAKLLSRPGSALDDRTRREVFEDIAAEAERLQRLVEDVVALNRFGEDDGELGQEPVLLQRVIPDVVHSEEARWPGVRFEMAMPSGLPTVIADPTYVEQVVRNLLSNAAKYGGSDATVDIVLETGEDEVLVRILDDGPGIDAGESTRLFDLFYRSASTAKTTSGAGIGLFVAARLVGAMGGRIWAHPRPAGGAEFGFALRVMAEG